MPKINSSTFNDFTRNITIQWRKGFERHPLRAMGLYDVIHNKLSVTDHSVLDGFTFARRKAEGDDARQENPRQSYVVTLTKYRVQLQAVITWEMRTYDKYREMQQVISGMGEVAARRIDLDLTHRFTFATVASYTDQDGVSVTTTTGDALALLSTAHTVTGVSTTYRNRVANNPPFGRAGLEAAELIAATQLLNSNGNKVFSEPDTIVVAPDPATVNNVREFLESTASPTVSNSGVENVYQAKYRLLVLPQLATTSTGARDSTKEKYWFLVNVAHTDAVLEISEDPHVIGPNPNGIDFENDDFKYKTSAAYGIAIIDPKFVIGSTGDDVA